MAHVPNEWNVMPEFLPQANQEACKRPAVGGRFGHGCVATRSHRNVSEGCGGQLCLYVRIFWPSDLEITRSRNLEKNALCVKKCIYIIDESWSTLSSSLTFPPSNEFPVAFGCSCLVHLQDFFICQIFCFFCQGCHRPDEWWVCTSVLSI